MRGLTNKPVLFPLRLTKKSLVTLNSPLPEGGVPVGGGGR